MNGRIAVIIPTRDRPEQLAKAIRSVLNTSTLADVLLYIDDDQKELYGPQDQERVLVFYGNRLGPVASANAIVGMCPDYDAYGLITDDSEIVTAGWDSWLLTVVGKFSNRIIVVSPHHNFGDHVDMPFVSREWIDAVGWFACPHTYHYAWPIITGLIGEMTAIVNAEKDLFHIEHDYDPSANSDLRDKDYRGFFAYVSAYLFPAVVSLRQLMYRKAAV